MGAPALRYRALWLALGYGLVGVTVWGSLTPAPPGWAFALGDKLLHGATYCLLTFWFGQLYPGAMRQGVLVLAFTAFGVLLEVGQGYSSVYRHFDQADAAASAIGAALAWALLRTRCGHALEHVDAWLGRRMA